MTGRNRLMLIPESQEVSMGAQAYQEVLKSEKISSNVHWHEVVNRVGSRIAQISGRPDYQWEFKLIESPTQNAFCLPGGKVAVYDGILPVCENEAGLAVVMSHEVAHALARHGGERMSQEKGVQTVAGVLGYSLQGQSELTRNMILKGYGVASHVGVVLKHSREHELEADRIGVMLMAQAGYDPAEAPRFWQRFQQADEKKPVEWLSTHPSDARRVSELQALLPQAELAYNSAANKIGLGEFLRA